MRILVLLLYVLEIWSYPSKHWSAQAFFFFSFGILILSFQTLDFWSFFYTHRCSDLLLLNCGILALVVYTLVFWSYHSKRWNSGRISISIGISIVFFPILQFLPYFCKHWNSDLILSKVGTLGLLSYTLALWSYPFKHGNCGQIKTGILILFFKTFEFWCFFCKRRNSDLILSNFGILALFSLPCLL